MVYQNQVDIPKLRSFSLGDFHDFERCSFAFFVRHHLEKKYELEEGNANQTIGSLLDLALKKYHTLTPLQQSDQVLPMLIRSAATQIKSEAEYNASRGKERSFYSSNVAFLTEEVIEKATQVMVNYFQQLKGKINPPIHKNKLKPFWKFEVLDGESFRLWGGADAIELGEDGVPEVVDYKYYDEASHSKDYLDLDLMSKLYVLLAADELVSQGYKKARFKVRLWNEPLNQDLYEEFDLSIISSLADYFTDKVRRILGAQSISFCEAKFCKVCNHENRPEWLKELETKGWIKVGTREELLQKDFS